VIYLHTKNEIHVTVCCQKLLNIRTTKCCCRHHHTHTHIDRFGILY